MELTKAGHSGGATVTNISSFAGWGDPASSDFTIDPWSMDS